MFGESKPLNRAGNLRSLWAEELPRSKNVNAASVKSRHVINLAVGLIAGSVVGMIATVLWILPRLGGTPGSFSLGRALNGLAPVGALPASEPWLPWSRPKRRARP